MVLGHKRQMNITMNMLTNSENSCDETWCTIKRYNCKSKHERSSSTQTWKINLKHLWNEIPQKVKVAIDTLELPAWPIPYNSAALYCLLGRSLIHLMLCSWKKLFCRNFRLFWTNAGDCNNNTRKENVSNSYQRSSRFSGINQYLKKWVFDWILNGIFIPMLCINQLIGINISKI